MRVKKAVEFCLSLSNRPGAAAELTSKLAARDINIKAFMLYTSFIMNIPNVPQVAGVCKVLVDNDQQARDVFRDLDLTFREEEVLLLRAPDRPGVLAAALRQLAEAGLNVKDGYASVPSGQEDVVVVLSVSDIQKAVSIFSVATQAAV